MLHHLLGGPEFLLNFRTLVPNARSCFAGLKVLRSGSLTGGTSSHVCLHDKATDPLGAVVAHPVYASLPRHRSTLCQLDGFFVDNTSGRSRELATHLSCLRCP